MRQQVNLYIEPEQPAEVWLSFTTMLRFSVTFLLLLMAITIIVFAVQYQKQRQLTELEKTKKNLNVNLVQTKSSLSSEQERKRLTLQLQRQQSLQQTRQKMYTTLSALQHGEQVGFSSYLRGLTQHDVEGIWLTHIIINAGGEHIGLQGHAFKAQLVPALLQSLSQDNTFKGKSFEQLQVLTTKESDYLLFDLESRMK